MYFFATVVGAAWMAASWFGDAVCQGGLTLDHRTLHVIIEKTQDKFMLMRQIVPQNVSEHYRARTNMFLLILSFSAEKWFC